jgi:hypothetical protein
MSSNAVYRRNTDILSANVDDDLVMMSIQAGNYYNIGGVGTFIWELLAEPKSMDELVDGVMADYDVERERCAVDVGAFIEELIRLKLIESA